MVSSMRKPASLPLKHSSYCRVIEMYRHLSFYYRMQDLFNKKKEILPIATLRKIDKDGGTRWLITKQLYINKCSTYLAKKWALGVFLTFHELKKSVNIYSTSQRIVSLVFLKWQQVFERKNRKVHENPVCFTQVTLWLSQVMWSPLSWIRLDKQLWSSAKLIRIFSLTSLKVC